MGYVIPTITKCFFVVSCIAIIMHSIFSKNHFTSSVYKVIFLYILGLCISTIIVYNYFWLNRTIDLDMYFIVVFVVLAASLVLYLERKR